MLGSSWCSIRRERCCCEGRVKARPSYLSPRNSMAEGSHRRDTPDQLISVATARSSEGSIRSKPPISSKARSVVRMASIPRLSATAAKTASPAWRRCEPPWPLQVDLQCVASADLPVRLGSCTYLLLLGSLAGIRPCSSVGLTATPFSRRVEILRRAGPGATKPMKE